MKQIVIVGGGFAGLSLAKSLSKKVNHTGFAAITLMDRNNYLQFTPNLYEIATSDEEITSPVELKNSTTLSYNKLLTGSGVNFVQDKLVRIELKNKRLIGEVKQLHYDYLILALGSTTDYFNVPGAEQYALPLKTVTDALRIRNQIAFALERYRLDVKKKNLRIMIAGGGYTGVEFAGELARSLPFIAWKNQYPLDKIEVVVLEGTAQLIPGLDPKLSIDAWQRLRDLGVRIQLSSMITAVDDGFVTLSSGEKESYDVLVWTTGVKSIDLPLDEPVSCDHKQRCMTTPQLQLVDHRDVFAVGDCACVMSDKGQPAPPTAQDAIDQARYLATALPLLLTNQQPQPYHPKPHGYIIPIGGKWSILRWHKIYFTGFLAYVIGQLAHLRFFMSVLSWPAALRYLLVEVDLYRKNDD